MVAGLEAAMVLSGKQTMGEAWVLLVQKMLW
jgi:hypothetical protein